jgi:hypothetical protein
MNVNNFLFQPYPNTYESNARRTTADASWWGIYKKEASTKTDPVCLLLGLIHLQGQSLVRYQPNSSPTSKTRRKAIASTRRAIQQRLNAQKVSCTTDKNKKNSHLKGNDAYGHQLPKPNNNNKRNPLSTQSLSRSNLIFS